MHGKHVRGTGGMHTAGPEVRWRGAGQDVQVPDQVQEHLLAGKAALLVRDCPHEDGVGGIAVAIAGLATPALANFMATHCRGIVSATLDAEHALRLGIGLGSRPGDREKGRNFLVSVEAACCDGTGISAADRALTLRTIGAPGVCAPDLVTPGHIMPMLVQTVVSKQSPLPDIAHMLVENTQVPDTSQQFRSAAWCDVLDDDGRIASAEHCIALAARHGLTAIYWDGKRFMLLNDASAPTARTHFGRGNTAA